MHNGYDDIRSRVPMEPLWWDERGVPRYCDFAPHEAANIYASQVALLRIECQGCRRPFLVAMSSHEMDGWGWVPVPDREIAVWQEVPHELEDLVVSGEIHYGDPPNAGCCAAGPTMNSVPVQVVEFWHRRRVPDWERRPELERAIECDWDEPDDEAGRGREFPQVGG